MGLLDGVLGNVLGGMLGGSQRGGSPLDSILGQLGGRQDSGQGAGLGGVGGAALMALALQLIQQNGGISGLADKFRSAGLGQHADSWIGTGANMPLSADQIQDALGGGALGQLASRFGLSPDQASGGLAQVLPELVNHMTPAGEVPSDQNDVIAQALEQLRPVTKG
ncbi:MAG: YidB family protein [Betaproteobacteria bacterium]